ncbi:MAG: Gfo/Idh/MocA family oxidoreductase [Erysipelotrichales bacterium]|nr:MAG: Gfo/Idh/MocA family oxidoreductase [Erysipelotrichales bacterium]
MVRFGIIGCGKITERFLTGCRLCDDADVVAAASRDLQKAEVYCARHDIDRAYGSYEALCADNTVDAVYIATPPFSHYRIARMALESGKHVLCEKPFVANEDEVKALFGLARERGLLIMEAMKAVFTPTTLKVKEWLEAGLIGMLKYAEAGYCYDAPFDFEHWVYDPERMGGGMLDVGVYAIAYLNELISHEIVESVALKTLSPTGCDEFMQILIKYDNGVQASVRGALSVTTKNTAYFYGTQGYIEVDQFWKSKKAQLVLYNGESVDFEDEFPSEFKFQIEHFAACIKKGTFESPVMGEQASLAIIRLINQHL